MSVSGRNADPDRAAARPAEPDQPPLEREPLVSSWLVRRALRGQGDRGVGQELSVSTTGRFFLRAWEALNSCRVSVEFAFPTPWSNTSTRWDCSKGLLALALNSPTRNSELTEVKRGWEARRMWTGSVRILDDLTAADWLAQKLTETPSPRGPILRTNSMLPSDYEAYARVLHPVELQDREYPSLARWADVAATLGRPLTPLTRWYQLVGNDDMFKWTSSEWTAGTPERGSLEWSSLRALCNVLSEHTTTPDDCFFAIWNGWGWLAGGNARVNLGTDGGTPADPRLLPSELESPRLRLPGRDYFVARGPLSAMSELVHYDGPGGGSQSPSLFWPRDRAWFVSTEVDMDSTFLGASADATRSVQASSELEAVRFAPTR